LAPLKRGQRHPLILHWQHHFTKLLIQQTHIRLHQWFPTCGPRVFQKGPRDRLFSLIFILLCSLHLGYLQCISLVLEAHG
jgi:hypothetical protein